MRDDETTAEDLKVVAYDLRLLLFLLACGVLAFFLGLVWFFES
jgi:hypothetical protein